MPRVDGVVGLDTPNATIGWAELAGPIGAAVIGVFALVFLFHKSTGASKEAAAAAKAYSDALTSGGGKAGLVDSIATQLKNANLPATLATVNTALHGTAITGGQFVTAIDNGGKPLEALRARLQAGADDVFLVSVPFGDSSNLAHAYFVTNSHIADRREPRTIRLNPSHGGRKTITPVPDAWMHHPDRDDVAIAAIDTDWETLQFSVSFKDNKLEPARDRCMRTGNWRSLAWQRRPCAYLGLTGGTWVQVPPSMRQEWT